MKQAYFLAVDNGIDGREPDNIRFASLDEKERDDFIASSPNKAWLRPVDKVADLHDIALRVWAKLDALEQLSFLDTSAPMWQADFTGDKK